MKSQNVSLISAIIVFLTAIMMTPTVFGGEVLTCQGQNVSHEQLSAAGDSCEAEMKDLFLKLGPNPTPKEMKHFWKNTCYMSCVWEKLGVVSNGAANTTGIANYIASNFPASARIQMMAETSNCVRVYGTGLVKTDDCKSYKPFSKCLYKAIKKVCKLPGGPGGTMSPSTGTPSPSGRRRRRQVATTQKPTPGQDASSSDESDEK